MSNLNKSALTDHATTGNHITDWEGAEKTDRATQKNPTSKGSHLDQKDKNTNEQRRGQLRAIPRV